MSGGGRRSYRLNNLRFKKLKKNGDADVGARWMDSIVSGLTKDGRRDGAVPPVPERLLHSAKRDVLGSRLRVRMRDDEAVPTCILTSDWKSDCIFLKSFGLTYEVSNLPGIGLLLPSFGDCLSMLSSTRMGGNRSFKFIPAIENRVDEVEEGIATFNSLRA
ncbi:hypothetical protein L1887_23766 [Cichorium endivia]|nr:hypothetical protein L1887_23766 [Cichorium endivia]